MKKLQKNSFPGYVSRDASAVYFADRACSGGRYNEKKIKM